MATQETNVKKTRPFAEYAENAGTNFNSADFSGTSAAGAIDQAVSGFKNVFEGAVELVDKTVKGNIKDDVTAAEDAFFSEVGVPGRSAPEASINLPDLPEGMKSEFVNLENAREAVRQGKLNKETYALRMDSVSRQLRIKYPGYRDEVDTLVQKAAGFRPANRVMNDMFDEMDAADSDRAARRTNAKKVQHRANAMAMTPEERTVNDQYLDAIETSGWATSMTDQYDRFVGKMEQKDSILKGQVRTLETTAMMKTATRDKTKQMAKNFATTVATFNTDFAFNPLQEDGKGAVSLMESVIRPDSDGGISVSKDERLMLAAQGAKTRFYTGKRIRELWGTKFKDSGGNVHTYGDFFDLNEALKENDEFVATLYSGLIKDPLTFGSLVDTYTKANIEQLGNEALLNDGNLSRLAALAKVLGNNPAFGPDLWKAIQGQLKEPATQQASMNNFLKLTSPSGITQDATLEREIEAGNYSPEQLEAVVTTSLNAITTLANPQMAEQAFKKVFTGDRNILRRFNKKDKLRLFQAMSSPAVVDFMKKTRDVDLKNNYRGWLADSFSEVFREDIANVGSTSAQGITGFQLEYTNDNKFELTGTGDSPLSIPVRESIRKVNTFLSVWENAYPDELTPEKKTLYTKKLLETSGVSTTPGTQGGLFNQMYNAVVGSPDTATEAKGSSSGGTTITPTPGPGEAARASATRPIGEEVAKAESGSSSSLLGESQNSVFKDQPEVTSQTLDQLVKFSAPGGAYSNWSKEWKKENGVGDPDVPSTPMGTYQITGTTLKGLMKNLGLKGNEVFTEDLQHRLFNELIKGRGLDDFLAGKIDVNDMVARIGKEWEGVARNSDTQEAIKRKLLAMKKEA
jgi:hypothetical protein